MSGHTLYCSVIASAPAGAVVVEGDEARHALRVKRLGVGDPISLCDGEGARGRGTIARVERVRDGWRLVAVLAVVEREPIPTPRTEVWSAVPKGDHLGVMIDMLSQAGVWMWRPLICERGVAGSGDAKIARLERRSLEAMKQCGRAWKMRIGTAGEPADAFDGGTVLVADQDGAVLDPGKVTRSEVVRLLIGPEGGWTEAERRAFRERGGVAVTFGAHTLRIETAAVMAAAIVLNALARLPDGCGTIDRPS